MSKNTSFFQLAVIVSALGFFVDVYDLLLFAIIRKPSLTDLGLSPEQVLTQGEYLISVQMIGLLLGGILFGIIGDKKGRLSVLFGSILLYSIANILNGMVVNVNQYAILRFIAGVGLAGELGAGVTLVSELLPKEKRSVATGFIAGFGIFGVVFAFLLSRYFDWRTCYYIGGGLGILLLLMRVSVHESGLFAQVKQTSVQRGNFMMFFTNKKRFIKYLQCVLIGLPVWYIIGVLVTFADQFGQAFGIVGIDPARAIVYLYLGVALGDFSVGWLSERLKSRKKTYFIFVGITLVFCTLYFLQNGNEPSIFYALCGGMGFGAGFNVVYITMGVEQFGTNLRASAAISIPNMVRGALPLILWLFKSLRNTFNHYLMGAVVTGIILFVMAIVAAWFMEETYGKELDFVEE
ncbi:MFS transporter [Haliscomenobacter hydrossis]|uniref:Major facilitator superfamily MFS_1 n=1 Tax=Haliscomenobacter hydrossis (strain ATCC 27775 / DSM 1100 / LMG 10767 / O) TaxID=760192 RepID=F4KVW2_HALH1|nr:MFS transporter [Haliscomenobacter hydrossis]AEE53537.1 major facilitator superfamily MFS_1 [Haliscomenobacter hydrossis DSM 1100]